MAKSFLISSGSSNSPSPSLFTLKCFSNFLAPQLSRSIDLSPPDLRLAGHKRDRLRNVPRQMRDVSTVPSGVSSRLSLGGGSYSAAAENLNAPEPTHSVADPRF